MTRFYTFLLLRLSLALLLGCNLWGRHGKKLDEHGRQQTLGLCEARTAKERERERETFAALPTRKFLPACSGSASPPCLLEKKQETGNAKSRSFFPRPRQEAKTHRHKSARSFFVLLCEARCRECVFVVLFMASSLFDTSFFFFEYVFSFQRNGTRDQKERALVEVAF